MLIIGRSPPCRTAPTMTLSAVLVTAVLLAAAGVQQLDAAAPAACTAIPGCNLSQCPCYAKQIDDSTYARPAGCVPSVRCPVPLLLRPCRWSSSLESSASRKRRLRQLCGELAALAVWVLPQMRGQLRTDMTRWTTGIRCTV